jgi:hypothetical protein
MGSCHAVEKAVVRSGKAWISTTRLSEGKVEALRACVTSYRVTEEDLRALVDALGEAVGR